MKTVLIADDQLSIRLLVMGALESDDMEVIEASDGNEAWALMQERRPDLALLDVQMPGRTGLELVHAIREEPGLAGMHVILVTAGLLKSEENAPSVAEADGFVTKPFSPIKLREQVERMLNEEATS